MSPKSRFILQSKDALAWGKSDEAFNKWEATIHSKTMYRAVANFILKYRSGEVEELYKPIMGGYNILYRLEYKDGSSVALRVPCKEFLYRQMAKIVLQLSTLKFPRIGFLVEDKEGAISAQGRPLIQNMNSIADHARVPPCVLPSKTYSTATEWYSALADMHLAQLVFQHNDAVDDEDDARDKYVAHGTFRLWSENLRPSNVLIDEDLRVVAVVDWELAAYEPRLKTFLRILEDEEQKLTGLEIAKDMAGMSPSTKTLAQRMRESWETNSWMVNFASRRSWSFDALFWRYLDPVYFGPNEDGDHKARLDLLPIDEAKAIEPFVRTKMEEAKERILVEWEQEKAVALLDK
ncbi:hypothetical protein IFR05_013212, partial [Cadophora sp. M221]